MRMCTSERVRLECCGWKGAAGMVQMERFGVEMERMGRKDRHAVAAGFLQRILCEESAIYPCIRRGRNIAG